MKIKLSEKYFIRIDPSKVYKHVLYENLGDAEKYINRFKTLDECVDTCIAIIMNEEVIVELSLSEYIHMADRLKEELFQGVIEYGS